MAQILQTNRFTDAREFGPNQHGIDSAERVAVITNPKPSETAVEEIESLVGSMMRRLEKTGEICGRELSKVGIQFSH